jgi:hypothetical protein
MSSANAPTPVNFPKPPKSRRARRLESVRDLSQTDLSLKGGTPLTLAKQRRQKTARGAAIKTRPLLLLIVLRRLVRIRVA